MTDEQRKRIKRLAHDLILNILGGLIAAILIKLLGL